MTGDKFGSTLGRFSLRERSKFGTSQVEPRTARRGVFQWLAGRHAPFASIGILCVLSPIFAPLTALAATPEDSAPERERQLAKSAEELKATASTSKTGMVTARGESATADLAEPDRRRPLDEDAKRALRQHAQVANGDDAAIADGDETAEEKPADAEAPRRAADVIAPGQSSDKSGASSQAISVPKGSGTIEGMGESFSSQLSTGIASFSVPFALPAARGGAQPSLSLSYSSASGWGVAGLGWDVGVPYIARQTDRGPPRYGDRADYFDDQDRFVYNGGQELVPICTVGGSEAAPTCSTALSGEVMPPWSFGSQYFRPRVEGSYLRFFWSADHQTWRVQDKSGVTMELGAPLDSSNDRSAIESNPDNPSQISRWSLVRQYDTQGTANPTSSTAKPTPVNVVIYRYDILNGPGVLLTDIYDTAPALNPPLSNDPSYLSKFAHHTHLRYEERPDPTVSYRMGWEIQRRKRLIGVDVTSTTFNQGTSRNRQHLRRYYLTYQGGFYSSLLASVQVEGRCGSDENSLTSAPSEDVSGLLPASNCPRLPAMTFDYTHVAPYTTGGQAGGSPLSGFEPFDERIHLIEGSPDRSAADDESDFFDLNADALPDFMVTQPGIYGSGFGVFLNSANGIADTFSDPANLAVVGVDGATAGNLRLSNPNVTPLDADGDGIVDLLHAPAAKTYAIYKIGPSGWVGKSVTTASQQDLKIDFGRDALTTRVLDVNGDGLIDVVVSTGTEMQTFLGLGREHQGQDQFGTAIRTGPATAKISNEPLRTCLPWSSTAVSFGDREIQLGDFNGDGLQDIVRLQRGNIRYWPGRGNGMWGTGQLADCTPGTFASDTDITMDESPTFSDLSGSSLRVDDVNGDGFDDLIEVRSDAVDVWLNVNGASWTPRHIIEGTPSSPANVNRVRLLDLNGSGTRDLVWAGASAYKYIDLQGGQQHGLLKRVSNGLGKTTDIDYSTSTAEMLAAERLGGTCTSDTWTGPWCSKMPIVAQLVKRTTESDNFTFGTALPNTIVTEYEYRDPVYDGRQREFRGFKRARSKKIGDSNSPTSYSESQFLLGECVSDANTDCDDRSVDNPREALKGLPIVTETYSATGVYLSTDLTAYRLRRLYTGRDGRDVRVAFQVEQRKTLYDTYLGAPTDGSTTTFSAVEVENSIDTSFNPIANPTAFPTTRVLDPAIVVPVRSSTNTATLASRSQVDYFGNQIVALDLGCIAGTACPAATTGIDANETIYSFTLPGRATGDETGWLFRTKESYVKGSARTQVRGRTLTTFDGKGNPTLVQKDLQGTVALDRRHRTLTGLNVVAPAPTAASSDAIITVAGYAYDSFGNRYQTTGSNGRCTVLSFEGANATGYAQFPTSETVYTTPNCAGSSLVTQASAYDRGLGKPTIVVDVTGQSTSVAYDGLGRLSSLKKPNPTGIGTAQPSVSILYTLASFPARPYSSIETRTQDSADVTGTSYLWAVSFIDGMGRTRLTRAEADKVAGRDVLSAIHDGFVTYDAKGAVARKYLAQFATAVATTAPAAVSGSYSRIEYDAFGRTTKTFDLAVDPNPHVQTLQNDYHALSQDISDAADLGQDLNQAHMGTNATQRMDGHGRAIVTTERIYEGGVLDSRDIRTKYLTTGEAEVITRVHVGSVDAPVVRWMRYDTLGRLVLNVDAHTSLNFSSDPTTSAAVATNGLRAWRYAYDDAGDLVGTSDARGCGTNYTYDAAGRVISEDYSPCEAAHAPYSTPDASTHTGIEVYYQYDSVPSSFSSVVGVPLGSGESGVPAAYPASSGNLKGRLAAAYDRSGLQLLTYDNRGRVTNVDRRMADPDPTVTDPRQRYRGRWYSTDTGYDAADRVVRQSTGAKSPELLVSGSSDLQVEYSGRGTIKRIYGSYGDFVTSAKRTADGLLEEVVYGDAATTTAAQTYNVRRWLATSKVSRIAPSFWATPPADYLPAPTLATPSSFQTKLRDESFFYDIVGSPTSIVDGRTATEWPAGAQPVTRNVQYDDLYRVTQVDYAYTNGSDTFVSPFAAELAGSSDPRQSSNVPTHLLPSQRVKQQTYKYDWLGSLTSADDDQHAMWDRGVGPMTNYAGTSMPYRWKNAGDLAVPTWPGSGTAEALAYDEAGNLLDLQTTKVGTCTNGAGSCAVRFTYGYDEVGRLNKGVRIEGGVTKADLRFTYDHSDSRVVKGDYSAGTTYYTVYLFGSLELRRTTYDSSSGDYAQNASTETPFLNVGGEGLGRIVYQASAYGEPQIAASSLHVLLNIGDHLGSASIVVDKVTGELAERRTYLAYGATESDYRPSRWKGYREDYGFTGKEEDIEIGLQYFGKRYLSPYLGRWVSTDPLAVHVPGKADLNVYAYVHGKVLKSVDPQGLQEVPLGGWSDPTAVLNMKSEQALRWMIAKSANVAAVAGITLACVRFPSACRHIALGTAMATAGSHDELARNVGEYVALEIGAKAVGVVGGKLIRSLAKTEVEALEHGVKAATLSERVEIAAKSFKDAGVPEKKLGAMLQGVDLTKQVQIRQLHKGDLITQYQAPDSPTGRWFAPRGTAVDTLGINSENRVMSTYVVKEDMKVMESTAADTTGNPWVPKNAQGKGGGTQYFAPDSSKLQKVE
jgi:RHS repeat-associated protein